MSGGVARRAVIQFMVSAALLVGCGARSGPLTPADLGEPAAYDGDYEGTRAR